METFTFNTIGKVRTEYLNGKRFLVAPSTYIVPGVLPGSEGPLLYEPHEIAKNPDDWNMMPLLDGHPYEMGTPVSGRSPDILNKQQIGFTFHTHVKDDALKGEAWFDEDLTQKVNPRIWRALKDGTPIGVSTGLYTQNIPAPPGSHYSGPNGPVAYSHIATNYKPDHMAVLIDQKGACSIRDGCGVLVNQLTNNTLTFNSQTLEEGNLLRAMVNNTMPPSMDQPNTAPTGSANPQTSGPGPALSPDGSQSNVGQVVPTPETVRASTATKEAVRASGNANLAGLDTKYGLTKNTPEAHSAAVNAHDEAAAAHEKAAKYHNEIGNTEDAMSHAQHAMSHHSASKIHSKLVDDCMQRLGGRPYKMAANTVQLTSLGLRLVNKLVTNCACKVRLVRNDDGSMGMEEASGDDEGAMDLNALAKVMKVKSDAKRDPAGYIKELTSGMSNIMKGLAGDNSDMSRPSGKGKYQGEGQGRISSTDHSDEISGSQGSGDAQYEGEEHRTPNSNPNELNSDARSTGDGDYTEGNLGSDEGHELNAFNGGSSGMATGEDDEEGMPPKSEGMDAGNNPGTINPGMGRRTDPNKQDAAQRQPVGNSRNGTMQFLEMIKKAPPEVIAVWNNAVEITEREKQGLISRIVANVHGELRESVKAVYQKMGLPELRKLVQALPEPVMNQAGPYVADPFTQVANAQYPSYMGAGGGYIAPQQVTPNQEIPSPPVNNTQVNNESPSILPLPSMTYEYTGKSRRKQG